MTACTFLSSEFLHLIAKWFRFEHFEQVLPHAGHFDFRRTCLRPQKRHSISSLDLTRLSRYDFVTFLADLKLCMSSHFKDSSRASVASAALQMYTVCYKVRFVICNSFCLVLLSLIPITNLSRNSQSCRHSQKLQFLAKLRKSLMYISIDSLF